MEERASREAQLRRDCRALGMILRKARRRAGSEHGPFHILEPVKNLALSAALYPSGMTLVEAEAFVSSSTGYSECA
jgi:hypothetical protein